MLGGVWCVVCGVVSIVAFRGVFELGDEHGVEAVQEDGLYEEVRCEP